MANIKISELNELEQVDNDDLLVIVDTSTNETKKVKARNVGTGGGGSDVVIISDTQPTSEDNKLFIDTSEDGDSFTEITNEYSTSTGKGYSANYINELNTYSTTEQRVGTWIDGKPLYRRVFNGTTASTAGQIATIGNIANLDTIIDIYGSIMSSGGYWANVPMYYVNPNTSTTYYCVAQVDPSKNVYVLSSYISTNVKVIVEYTKTTD